MERIRIVAEGDYACFTRPEMKVERVSYDVPTPGAIEGMLKSIYWKPAIRFVVDRIVVYNPINFFSVRKNEIKDKLLPSAVKKKMANPSYDLSIYSSESRTQRSSLLLKDVRYGVEFHIEMTGIRSEKPDESLGKHYAIMRRRLEKGQQFRTPCFGQQELFVRKIELVNDFDIAEISPEIIHMGDYDLGYMLYGVAFADGGIPKNGDWDNPIFSDKAKAIYYRPHMVNGVIDVSKYRGGIIC